MLKERRATLGIGAAQVRPEVTKPRAEIGGTIKAGIVSSSELAGKLREIIKLEFIASSQRWVQC